MVGESRHRPMSLHVHLLGAVGCAVPLQSGHLNSVTSRQLLLSAPQLHVCEIQVGSCHLGGEVRKEIR